MGTVPEVEHEASVGDGASYCPYFQHVVELLGRRWTGVIVRAIAAGAHRFGEVRQAVPGLSDRLLSDRLDELEAEGIISRCIGDETIAYGLTERGEDLRPILAALEAHASRWAPSVELASRPGRRKPDC